MSSASSYDPAPPAPQGDPAALVNGRPMSRPQRSSWPDRNPAASARATLWSMAAAAAFLLGPFVVDALGGAPWRTSWFFIAFGVGFLVQAGMDTARPAPGDRVGVVVYRLTYFLTPVLVVVLVMVVGDPFATG